MTLKRTIHRRNARKRAKARPKSHGRSFLVQDWVAGEAFDLLRHQAGLIDLLNRASRQERKRSE